MNTTDLLIIATAAGPVVATLVAPGFISAVLMLAKARAQHVQHVPASGTDLYHNGVPLTETQFREVFAAYQSELAELPPPADRTEWDMKRQFAAAQRLSVLTGRHPHAFPNIGDADQAWEWYAPNNPYATAGLPHVHGMPVSPDWMADPGRWCAALPRVIAPGSQAQDQLHAERITLSSNSDRRVQRTSDFRADDFGN